MNTLGAPLAYNAKKRGYHYDNKAYVLPALMLKTSDIETLRLLIAHLEHTAAVFGDNGFSDRAVQLLRQIIAQLSVDEEE